MLFVWMLLIFVALVVVSFIGNAIFTRHERVVMRRVAAELGLQLVDRKQESEDGKVATFLKSLNLHCFESSYHSCILFHQEEDISWLLTRYVTERDRTVRTSSDAPRGVSSTHGTASVVQCKGMDLPACEIMPRRGLNGRIRGQICRLRGLSEVSFSDDVEFSQSFSVWATDGEEAIKRTVSPSLRQWLVANQPKGGLWIEMKHDLLVVLRRKRLSPEASKAQFRLACNLVDALRSAA